MVAPVLLVLGTDSRQLQRKWRIPVGHAFGLRDAGILRREPAVGGDARNRHDARQREVCLRRAQAGGRVPQVVLERDRIAGACAELASGPVVEDDPVCTGHDSQRRAKIRPLARWGQTRV